MFKRFSLGQYQRHKNVKAKKLKKPIEIKKTGNDTLFEIMYTESFAIHVHNYPKCTIMMSSPLKNKACLPLNMFVSIVSLEQVG